MAPAAKKANIQEAGADVKESALFSGASNMEDEVLLSQSPSPWEDGGAMETLISKPITPSQCRQRFL